VLLLIVAVSGCVRPAPTAPITAPPVRTGLDAEAFRPLAESWVKAGPSRRWEYVHGGIEHKDSIERFYSTQPPEPDVTGVEVGRVRLLEADTAAVVEVIAHAGPVTRTTWLYVSKRDGPGWFVEWEKTKALADGE
jgi:hypothetical protein